MENLVLICGFPDILCWIMHIAVKQVVGKRKIPAMLAFLYILIRFDSLLVGAFATKGILTLNLP